MFTVQAHYQGGGGQKFTFSTIEEAHTKYFELEKAQATNKYHHSTTVTKSEVCTTSN